MFVSGQTEPVALATGSRFEQKIYNGRRKWLPAAATGPADQQIPLARRPDLEMNVIRRLHLGRSAPVPLMQPHDQQDAAESKQFRSPRRFHFG